MRTSTWFSVLVTAGALGAAPCRALTLQHVDARQDLARDRGAPPGRLDDFLDTTFAVAWDRMHVALTVGNDATGLRCGGLLRDRRGSSYGAVFQRRTGGFLEDTSLAFDTAQKFERLVACGTLRFLWPDHPETTNLLVVPSAGAELYYDDWSYASGTVFVDPRRGGGLTIRFANRLGNGRAHLDVALAPRTDGVVNWSCGARWRMAYVGYAREHDFDFSGLDRSIWSAGFHWDFAR